MKYSKRLGKSTKRMKHSKTKKMHRVKPKHMRKRTTKRTGKPRTHNLRKKKSRSKKRSGGFETPKSDEDTNPWSSHLDPRPPRSDGFMALAAWTRRENHRRDQYQRANRERHESPEQVRARMAHFSRMQQLHMDEERHIEEQEAREAEAEAREAQAEENRRNTELRDRGWQKTHKGGYSPSKSELEGELSQDEMTIRQANRDERQLSDDELREIRYRATLPAEESDIRRRNQNHLRKLNDDEITQLTCEQLRSRLQQLGYSPGPCTPAVRPLLEKKLKQLQ